MGSRVGMFLWAWIILGSGVCSVELPRITDREFIDECVREHNKARSSVSPPASDMLHMTWDEDLAITARAWARHCEFKHNPQLRDGTRLHPSFPSLGENIWKGHPSLFNVSRVTELWVKEKDHYNYDGNTCSKVCGHYKQVVWGSSHAVGCAAELCPGHGGNSAPGEAVMFVCNYAPAGNIIGRRPYESQGPGPACSGCSGSCVDRLCRNSQTPDQDPQIQEHYWFILVVRPIGLIFTFITAYVVHHYYPDVFCYE